ncbi:hypothetical protein GA0116948_1158 [Chitinophaga costaii]|uniref:Tetratricopeptide repeat-containing protein n=1 Tax=Chitinophaga costaii TaxID=1335309 RepID=A0A1C4FJP9_9BACT|nr:hypothetical protein [Chitinophaga costaii]PUZ30009.1 hypothetical protein DCM91_00570 [Chitinophaga costaii]SCC56217.1 hypothetical protein GA0116948_1158 [Chitinophaga costaii]
MERIGLYTTPGNKEAIHQIITQEYRLEELVHLQTTEASTANIVVEDQHIFTAPQWHPDKLPVLFPPQLPFNNKTLLGLIFFQLGNFEKSAFYFSGYPQWLPIVELGYALQNGMAIPEEDVLHIAGAGNDAHTALHNAALALHYVSPDAPFDTIRKAYEKAIQSTVLSDRLACTAKQYATFLNDNLLFSQASQVLAPFVGNTALSPEAAIAMKYLACHSEMKQLTSPYDDALLTALKNDLWECLQYYEAHHRQVDAAFVLTDASYIATISNSYSEALGYIQRAINIFNQEELPVLMAQAQFQQAKLLYTWGQHGHPQFYRQAMKACQDALKVFTRDEAPSIFADIHHQLGVIYSEIPDELKKKSVWAAVSVSSFNEALQYYTKKDFPYEYGMICNNQGNAYTKYPAAIRTDNFDKALAWYREALDVRHAGIHPSERAITLLNYLEAAWHLNSEKDFDEDLFNDMLQKAQEVKGLPVSEELKSTAAVHLSQLNLIMNYEL